MKQLFAITPVYDLLLRGSQTTPIGLYQLQIATATQFCRLHDSLNCLTTIKARLKTLVDNGYSQADNIPTKRFRSPYYTLGVKGIQYLEETGVHIHESFRTDRQTNKHSLFIEHTLDLNDIVVSAALLQRTNPRYTLAGFIHERVLKRHPYKATCQSGNAAQTYAIIPDAFTTFVGEQRLQQMREWARQELVESGEAEAARYHLLLSPGYATVGAMATSGIHHTWKTYL
jgi:hypothetical protein